MTKYRCVILVPQVFEFKSDLEMEKVDAQAKRLAMTRPPIPSYHPRKGNGVYEGVLLECCEVPDNRPVSLMDLVQPGAA